MDELSSIKEDLAYWLSKPPEERVAGRYGDIDVHYLGRAQFIQNKRAVGRKKDLADLEALGEPE